MNEEEEIETPEPLFHLDLTNRGAGILAPMNLQELAQWVEKERLLWNPLRNGGEPQLQNAAVAFHSAKDSVNEALRLADLKRDYSHSVENARANIVNATSVLPYSQSVVGRQIAHFGTSVDGDERAIAIYIITRLSTNKRINIQADSLNTWRAAVEGTMERYELLSAVPESRYKAATEAIESLLASAKSSMDGAEKSFRTLEADFENALATLEVSTERSDSSFVQSQQDREAQFEKLKSDHAEQMAQIRKTFTEDIALKAPAEYWKEKHDRHYKLAWLTGVTSFVAIGGCAAGLAWFVHELLLKLPPNTAPELWRIGAIATFGLFSVWAARLFVRMFLSHLHLSGDAGERIVMIKTYLSLLEGERLASNEDRQLILQAIFRPASDGIVKDEAVPLSLFETLTRSK